MRLPFYAILGIVVFLSQLVVSCATITVNVYFPAEEVKQAYTSLEEEFLLEDADSSEGNKKDNKSNSPDESGSLLKYSGKPVVTVTKIVPLSTSFRLDLVGEAFAGQDVAKRIESEIRKLPEVIQAFKSRAARKSKINSLLSAGKIGEGKDGMLVIFGTLTPSEKELVEEENKDRKIIITGMAKAILKINKIEITPENIRKVYPEAAEQFAASRREITKSGWKLQLPDGRWVRKK